MPAVEQVKATTAFVYCAGTDLDLATSLSLCYAPKAGGTTVRVTPAMLYATYTQAELEGLTPSTAYRLWFEAVAEGQTIKSSEVEFTTLAPETSHMGWLELPAKGMEPQAAEYEFAAGERNYTAYYDKATYSSLWVAYPLAKGHMGSLSRPEPDPWAPRADIPESDQINVWDGPYGVSYGSTSYARGHQIANADRNGNSTMQNQTFSAINSTPQIQNGFNGGIWMNLEQALQNHAKSRTDTLYIATGPVYKTVGGSETVKYISPKEDTKQCPVPNYYYKVVLKVKRSGNAVTSAQAVGFWFEHKQYSGSAYDQCAVTVDEIERKTGFDFFANLPDEIEAAAEKNASWTTFTSF